MTEKSARRVRAAGRDENGFLLDDATAHKLRSVLRLSPGDAVTVVDDSGVAYPCRISSLQVGHACAVLTDEALAGSGVQRLPEPLAMTLGLAVIKGDRMDWAIEKLGEVGIARILPILCGRSPAREIGASKQERWTRIAEAAALQCGRSQPAVILPPAPSVEHALSSFAVAWHGDPAGAPGVQVLANAALPRPDLLLVGPEGGWTEPETTLLAGRSLPVNLGSFVLRTETAALALSFLAIQFISKDTKAL